MKGSRGIDATLEIIEPYPVNVAIAGGHTLKSQTRRGENNDSTLIRIRDGRTVQVVEPERGMLSEERYQFPPSGDGELGKGA